VRWDVLVGGVLWIVAIWLLAYLITSRLVDR